MTRGKFVATLVCLPMVALLAACPSSSSPTGAPETSPAADPFPGVTVAIGLPDDLPGFGEGTKSAKGFDVNLADVVIRALKKGKTPTNLSASQRDDALLLPGDQTEKSVTLVIAAYSITRERINKGVVFAGPYMKTPQAFLVKKGDTEGWNRDTVAGKDVCVVTGTTASDAHFPDGSNLVPLPQLKTCVDSLKAGEFDGVFDDELTLRGYENDEPGHFEIVPIPTIGNLQY